MLTDDAADAQEASTSIKEMKRLEDAQDAQDASERVNPYHEARTAAVEQGPSVPFASLFNLIPNVLALMRVRKREGLKRKLTQLARGGCD